MAQVIKIKRSQGTSAPSGLSAGELAYTGGAGAAGDSGSRLFIGNPADGTNLVIGGKYFTDLFSTSANGTIVANKLVTVDGSKKVNEWLVDNLTLDGNTIASSGNLAFTHGGTIDLSAQANEVTIPDNQAAAFEIKEGSASYLKFVTTNSSEKIITGKTFIVDGDGSTSSGGVSISNGLIDVKNAGSGTESQIKLYCGSGNLHAQTIQAADHSLSATNTLELPHVGTILATTDGAQTLTNKTITSPDINGGTIDGATIGGSSRGAGSFTTVNANSSITGASLTDGTFSVSSGAVTGATSIAVDNLTLDANTLSSTNSNGNIVLDPNGSGTVDVSSSRITSVSDPTAATDAATKAYVDAVKVGLDFKDSVRVATTANITIASDLNVGDTIDGVTLADGDRVLVKDQSTASQNGIYTAGASPARAADANADAEVTAGMFVFVEEGTANGDNGYVLTTDGTITLNSTALTFTQFSGAGQIVAGDALSKSGNTLNVNDDNITLEVSSDNLRINGISTTVAGDLLFGKSGSNTGYSRLPIGTYDSTHSVGQILQVGSSNNIVWTNTIDGGTFN